MSAADAWSDTLFTQAAAKLSAKPVDVLAANKTLNLPVAEWKVPVSVEPAKVAAKPTVKPNPLLQPIEPAFIDFKRNKLPAGTIENVKALLVYMGATVRFNELSRRCEINIPGVKSSTDNAESNMLALLNSEAARWELPAESIDKFLLLIADENAYNPFRNFVLSKPWDGVGRFAELAGCLVTKTPDLAFTGLRKTMLGVIAGNFNPSGIGDPPPVLTLTGAQGLGKTTLFRNLIPSEIENGFLEGVTLDPGSKDSVMESTTRALVELGELDATFKKADVARLKAFITRHKDTYREPYSKRDITRSRRTVFVASVNDKKFLVDRTGNRRFLVLEVQDVKLFIGDMQQVWAEVYEAWKAGERHWLNRNETQAIEAHNAEFIQHDEVADLVGCKFEWADYQPKAKFSYMNPTSIAAYIGFPHPNKSITNRVANEIRRLHILHKVPEDKRVDRKACFWVPM